VSGTISLTHRTSTVAPVKNDPMRPSSTLIWSVEREESDFSAGSQHVPYAGDSAVYQRNTGRVSAAVVDKVLTVRVEQAVPPPIAHGVRIKDGQQ
jgi:hypothetical protein